MRYAALTDMTARYGERELIQLTDPDNLAIDVARVELKLDDAQAVVDASVGRVYRLPLRGCARPATAPGAEVTYEVPPQLKRIACDLARYYLYDEAAPEEEIYRRFKAAKAELEAIATGDAVLACPWGGSAGELVGADSQSGAEVHFRFSPRQITDISVEDYR
ncbi:gp436 family protein [Variovorax boronicumulans]|uniref:gp436 family protein n=1 Tax=Variovorax boronicumulans TaxID=436515 RepID=UPI001C587007